MTSDSESVLKLSEQIQRILRGKGGAIQGAVLADLVSLYFAGHNPEIREEHIDTWLDTMRALIGPSVKQIKEGCELPWDE